ncbi:glycosyltransferase family 4 protein [Patescibacteria group bacterium]|nr:glycosyltransferase family 4 protein [Patescibacteria group bacterium]
MKQPKIKKPYLLYVGNAFPHKNLERLVSSFKIILKDKPYLKLVLVGQIDYFYQRLEKLVQRLGLKTKVIFTGKVTDQELFWLYNNALVYLCPSLEEGFGLPGLEAMARNLPVICSNQGPLPEIYKQAAIYFNPENIQQMAEMILKVVGNEDLREKLKKAGQIQSQKYSWLQCAQETLVVYKSVMGNK